MGAGSVSGKFSSPLMLFQSLSYLSLREPRALPRLTRRAGGTGQRLLALQRTGNRNSTTGALVNVGNNGFSWSSSVDGGINGLDLNFNSTNLNPSNANNRAHGFQVRCLQAFTGTLIFSSPARPRATAVTIRASWRASATRVPVGLPR